MVNTLFIKYRPNGLNTVLGHKSILKDLKKRAKENNYAQNMFFSGTTGLGKTTLIRIVSKNILCQNKDIQGNSCNVCDICKSIDNERNTSFYFEYNASELGIKEVTEIAMSAKRRPLGSIQKKIIVIDEMQEMKSDPARKALLKILENPTPNSYFILGSMDLSKVPQAIRDRCVPYKLRSLEVEDIANYLYLICEQEKIEIDDIKGPILVAIANASNGCMRQAVSFLERAIYSDLWTEKELLEELDIASDKTLGEITHGIITGDVEIINNFKFTDELLNKIRFLLNLLYKHSCGVPLNGWQKSKIERLISLPLTNIENIIDVFNNILMFPYTTEGLNEYIILKTIMLTKKQEEIYKNSKEVRRERRPRQ